MTPPTALRQLAPGLHVAQAPLRFMGMELGARMTVLQLSKGLLVYSPIAMDPSALNHLGTPRWVLAPSLYHHLYVGPWAEAGWEAWAAPGLDKKRPDVPFHAVLAQDNHPFGDEIELVALTCFSLTNEVVMLHKPSRSLVVCDLVFNIPPTAPWTTRAIMRAMGGYPGCKTTLLERFGMNKQAARADLRAITALDFDRIIVAHGDIVETGGKAALLNAFKWLGKL